MTSIIQAQGLCKQYRLGRRESYRTLRETLRDAAVAPWGKLASLWRGQGQGARPSIWALKDVSFDVTDGEVVGIIGRNGAGKSTLLKILARITEPTAGWADVGGRVGALLEVGTGFHPELTGRENVYLGGALLGMKRSDIERRFDEIVAFAEVEPFLDTPVKHFSSGMYLRLAFGVAAHLEPDILVVDEVLAVGDAAFQQKCLGKMEAVSREGRTVLFVSHNLPAVTRLCSRALLLDQGSLIEDGPAADVVASYSKRVSGSTASRSWSLEEAPGTPDLKLVSIAATSNGTPITLASVGDAIDVHVRYLVGVPGLQFRCVAKFFTQGVCAFLTIEPRESERPHAGYYRSTVRIPAHLLAEGEYIVDVSLFASRGSKVYLAMAKSALAFHVHDPMNGDSARGDYAQAFAGVVRPKLDWDMAFEAEPAAALHLVTGGDAFVS